MGYKRVPIIHTLDSIDGEDGLVVRLKSVSFGKVRRLLKLVEGTDEQEVMDELAVRFSEALVSWNLVDEFDQPVATSLDVIEEQDFDFVLKVINAWLEKMTGVGADGDLGKDSLSGASFPGRPLTMEAL